MGLPPLPSEDPTARDGRRDGRDEGHVSRGVVQLPSDGDQQLDPTRWSSQWVTLW